MTTSAERRAARKAACLADLARATRGTRPATNLLARVDLPTSTGYAGVRRHGNKALAGVKGAPASDGSSNGWRDVSTYGMHGGTDRRWDVTVSTH